MILSGIDEAALGPKLGPFCAALAEFDVGGADAPDPDLYEILSDSLSKTADGSGRLPVGDSKALYSPSRGIAVLENSLITVLSAAGLEFPMSLAELISAVCPPADAAFLASTPWFAGSDRFPLPMAADDPETLGAALTAAGRDLGNAIAERGVSIRRPSARFVTAGAFNRALSEGGGKGGAVRALITPLLKAAIEAPRDASGGNRPRTGRRVTVDRQGGRRYYGEWLIELLPGAPLRTVEEGPRRSAYTFDETSIEFTVGADGFRLETALASMLAKYIREAAMTMFNRWWGERVPGLRATAGYPADARRFLADLEAAGAIPEDRDGLIRRL